MSGTPRLGRGLDALFNEGARGSGVGTQSGLMLEVSAIQPDPNQPRKNCRPEAMEKPRRMTSCRTSLGLRNKRLDAV